MGWRNQVNETDNQGFTNLKVSLMKQTHYIIMHLLLMHKVLPIVFFFMFIFLLLSLLERLQPTWINSLDNTLAIKSILSLIWATLYLGWKSRNCQAGIILTCQDLDPVADVPGQFRSIGHLRLKMLFDFVI